MSLNPVSTNADQSREYLSSKTTSIDKVPNEILGYIFRFYVEMNLSPWNLTLISRSWRSAALTDPNLWTNLWISGRINEMFYREFNCTCWSIKNRRIYTSGKWQICTDNDDFLMSLEKTRSTILNIKYNLHEPAAELSLLLRPPLSSRIAKLELYWTYSPSITTLEDNLGPFTSLEYLCIRLPKHLPFITQLIDSVQATAFKLTELFLGGWRTEYNKVDSIFPLLQRVQYLEIENSHLADLIIPHCSRLIGFTCSDRTWPARNGINNNTLAGVQSFHLYGPPEGLHYFHLPSLQVLTITNAIVYTIGMSKQYEWTGPKEFTLPSLISLRAHCKSLVWLHHLHAPSLTELEIIVQVDPCGCTSATRLMEDTTLHPPCILKPSLWSRFSNISKLTLGARCKDDYFNIVMDFFPNIQSLHLIPRITWHQNTLGLPILDHLVNLSAIGSLPQLKIFKFGSQKDPLFLPKDTLDSRVNSIIKSRRVKGMDIVCLDVYWHKDREDIQLERYVL